jgi:hypothetical protein
MGYHDDKDCECTEFDHMVEVRLQEIVAEYLTLELQAMAGRIYKINQREDTGEVLGEHFSKPDVVEKICNDIRTYRVSLGCSPKAAVDEVVRLLEIEVSADKAVWG